MISKSRLFVLAAVIVVPVMAACSEATTAPEFKAKRMSSADSIAFAEMGCGDMLPWGKAPCIAQ